MQTTRKGRVYAVYRTSTLHKIQFFTLKRQSNSRTNVYEMAIGEIEDLVSFYFACEGNKTNQVDRVPENQKQDFGVL